VVVFIYTGGHGFVVDSIAGAVGAREDNSDFMAVFREEGIEECEHSLAKVRDVGMHRWTDVQYKHRQFLRM
jgi:hypothetical protein